MKRFSMVLMICLLTGGAAMAGPTVTIGRGPDYTYPTFPFSGEFQLTPNAELAAQLGSADPFQSFCLEVLEEITIGGTYNAVLNDEAIRGGSLRPDELSGPDGGDLISPETAFLYTEFRAGTLTGYHFSTDSDHQDSARALQEAFYYLEGEEGFRDWGGLSTPARNFVTLAEGAHWTTIGSVRVLNLYDLSPTSKAYRQDMLTLVPAPGALLLGGLGVGLVGWFRRRRTL